MTDIIHLKCPDCKKNLIGENNSRVFFCMICHHCFDIDESKIKKYPVKCIKPQINKDYSQIYFPFWKIESEYKIHLSEMDPPPISDEKIFYIPAFFIKNIVDFGDIGFIYMQKNVTFQSDKPRDLPIFPADRGQEKASAYPLLYLQQEMSQKKKSTTVEINIKHKIFSIDLIPFYCTDHEYLDSMLLFEYPSGAVI